MTAYGSMRQYSGIDFAVGEVHGLRSWLVDEYGRLRARHASAAPPWRPGVNTAICISNHAGGGQHVHVLADPSGKGRRATRIEPGPATIRRSGAGVVVVGSAALPDYSVTWDDGAVEVLEVLDTRCEPHGVIPDDRCTCGFYAYTAPVAELRTNGAQEVLGVVRGSGITLIGTKGFRCERAEILALLDPAADDGGPLTDWICERLTAIYPGVPLLPSRQALWDFAPIESALPAPDTDEFWSLP